MDEGALGGGADGNSSGAGPAAGSGDLAALFDEGPPFGGRFLPPPPRPLFLEEAAGSDGPTTCDMCSWAWQASPGGGGGSSFAFDNVREKPGELGWVLTLIIVSLTSALIGAVVVIVVLHCRRMKSSSESESDHRSQSHRMTTRPPISTPEDKEISTITPPTFPNLPGNPNNNGVWSWLSRRGSTPPCQLNNPPGSPAENHYTHMDDAYNTVGEALYAELDRDSSGEEHETESNSPAYQNSAYTDPDAPTSSAPSSAYYSDLSITTVPDRAYEVVGLATMPTWEGGGCAKPMRLAAISENASVPSDYV